MSDELANHTNLTSKKEGDRKPHPPHDWRAVFIEQLRRSANVTRSALVANVTREYVYQVRRDDPQFAAAWDDALEQAYDAMEEEINRRAFMGTEEPVFFQGAEVGRTRKYSDNLAMFILKAARPDKYRERVSTEVTGAGGGPVRIAKAEDLTDDELAAYLSPASGDGAAAAAPGED